MRTEPLVIVPWSPCPETHVESDPRIDKAIQNVAQALSMGMTEEDVLVHTMARGFDLGEAVNIIRAATILTDHHV